MVFDFKKEFKNIYKPKEKPEVLIVPKMKFLAVRGKGNPNDENGEYVQSIKLLYNIAYTIKMSSKSKREIPGFFDYVVPPLEGFWWLPEVRGMDYSRKNDLVFISLLRLPDFVTKEDFEWAIEVATKKKKTDFSKVEYFIYDEGLCVQMLHVGSYDNETTTVNLIDAYANENGYDLDFSNRYHHEIYLGDPRKANVEKLKTIIRHPIKKRS